MSATGYKTDWIAARYELDCISRNGQLRSILVDYLKPLESLEIVDLGSGLGSNLVYLQSYLSQDQSWTLVEVDPTMRNASWNWICGQLKDRATNNPTTRTLDFGSYTVHVEYVSQSLFELDFNQWASAHLICGNALLDVFTKSQLDSLVRSLRDTQAWKWFSIIYQDMQWIIHGSEDQSYVDAYHQHMRRDQSQGPALGPDCLSYLKHGIEFGSDQVIFGDSSWSVQAADPLVLEGLLSFYQKSIPEVLTTPEERRIFLAWLQDMQGSLQNGWLSASVVHQDMLWTPSVHFDSNPITINRP